MFIFINNVIKGVRMKFIFAGTTEIAYDSIKAAIEKGINIVAIITVKKNQISNISGYADFQGLAKENNIPLIEVENINDPDIIEQIRKLEPDYISVSGWSQLIGSELLKIPKHGCFNVHPSLLPEHRGKATIAWTIINGMKKSGVTLCYLEQDADCGDIISQKEFTIEHEDTTKQIYDKIKQASVQVLIDMLPALETGNIPRTPQDHMKATYWPRRIPEDGTIDWKKPANEIYNWIRGLSHPFPGAFTYFNKNKIMIWKSRISEKDYKGEPGEIVDINDENLVIKTGKKSITIKNTEEIKKHKLKKGDILNPEEYGIDKKAQLRRFKHSMRSIQSQHHEKAIKDKMIFEKLIKTPEFEKAQTISIYVSDKKEVDTRKIIKHALSIGKKIIVPSLKNKSPIMCPIDINTNLDDCVPYNNNQEIIEENLDLVIVPGIAFDENTARIGQGSGFYDQFLSNIKGKKPIIGLAYDFQITDEPIPQSKHDIKVDAVITERRLINSK